MREAGARATEGPSIAGTADLGLDRSENPPASAEMPHLSARAPEVSRPDDADRPRRGGTDPVQVMSVDEPRPRFAASTQLQPELVPLVNSELTVDPAARPLPLPVVESETGSGITEAVSAEVTSPQCGENEPSAATLETAIARNPSRASSDDPTQPIADDDRHGRPAVCPRCGVSCVAEDERRVFGFRTMRSTSTIGEQKFVLRRQSYCRKCRTEHAVTMRERRVLHDHEASRLAPAALSGAGDDSCEVEVSGEDAAAIDGARQPTGVDAEYLQSAPGQIGGESIQPQDGHNSLEDQPFEQAPATPPAADRPRTARQYRAPTAGRPGSGVAAGKVKGRKEGGTSHTDATVFDLRVLFDRHGGCFISLLPRRPAGWPEAAQVSIGAESFDVHPLQDGWYEEIRPTDLGGVLRQGAIGLDRDREWQLTGREVFTLAGRSALRGFVSCPRLEISRDHVVLCHSSSLRAVEAALDEAGCSDWIRLVEEGVPSEWTLLRHVVPSKTVTQSDASDILNILRPVPEIDIELEGGVRLEHNNWLLGRHPTIRIYGAQDHLLEVAIDGQAATLDASGGFTVPGMTELGDHQIWCGGITKRFSIVKRPLPSQPWSAHRFGSGSDRQGFTVCGPLVHYVAKRRVSVDEEDVSAVQVVPRSHRVLLGAKPGEIRIAAVRPGFTRMPCVTHVPFQPVWGLPLSPLLADKRLDSVRFLAAALPLPGASEVPLRAPHDQSDAVRRWCSYLLDASRKGLRLEPQSPDVAALWRLYRNRAREVRRRLE